MPTLVLPPRYTPDSIALWRAACDLNWNTERLVGWRVPEWLAKEEVALYGEPLFADAVAEQLGIALLTPPFDWLVSIPKEYVQRDISFITLGSARKHPGRAFIKPADDKCFVARVYEAGDELPNESVLPGTTPVLLAEPVHWLSEFRCFVVEGRIQTMSVYLRNGELAQGKDGDWPCAETELRQACEFAEGFLGDERIRIPPSVVVDVGVIEGRGRAVIEANAAWGSGIYGCDPSQVLIAVRRASVPKNSIQPGDADWLVSCPIGRDGFDGGP